MSLSMIKRNILLKRDCRCFISGKFLNLTWVKNGLFSWLNLKVMFTNLTALRLIRENTTTKKKNEHKSNFSMKRWSGEQTFWRKNSILVRFNWLGKFSPSVQCWSRKKSYLRYVSLVKGNFIICSMYVTNTQCRQWWLNWCITLIGYKLQYFTWCLVLAFFVVAVVFW